MRTSAANWKLSERWNRETFVECDCGYRGTLDQLTTNAVHRCDLQFRPGRRRIFCASLADWLDNEAPIEWLVDLLDLIRRTPNLDWLLLTKRIGNWRSRLDACYDAARSDASIPEGDLSKWIGNWLSDAPPSNVWLGATVVNQDEADRDVPKLLAVPARVRFLSIEPMLGPVDLTTIKHTASPGFFGDALQWHHLPACLGEAKWTGLDWIICGGESGPNARPMHPSWVRELRDQCASAGVPFLFKQWGEWAPFRSELTKVGSPATTRAGYAPATKFTPDGLLQRIGKKAAGRLIDGRTHDGFPVTAP